MLTIVMVAAVGPVELSGDAWEGLPLDVVSCTAFDPPSRVGCRKPCLDHPVVRGTGSAVA